MKVFVLKLIKAKPFIRSYITAVADYPVDHVWTDVEKQVTDKVIIRQGDIELEWNCSLSTTRLNRVLLHWNKSKLYFYTDENRCTWNKMLPLSEHIFNELKVLDPFKLLVTTTGYQTPERVKRKIRKVIIDVVNKVFAGEQENKEQKEQEQEQAR